jgi:uncharacterized protein DUF3606
MSDNLRLRKLDAFRISLEEFWERRDWPKVLKCSLNDLENAIAMVGPMVADVKPVIAVVKQRRALRKRRKRAAR